MSSGAEETPYERHANAVSAGRTSFIRLPRRFAPRNDKINLLGQSLLERHPSAGELNPGSAFVRR